MEHAALAEREVAGCEDEDTQRGKYLTFHLTKKDYGIEIRHVMDIHPRVSFREEDKS